MTANDPGNPEYRGLNVLMAMVIGVALIGFVVGTHSTDPEPPPPAQESPVDPAAPPAADYTQLRQRDRGANVNWRTDFTALARDKVEVLPPGPERDEARGAALVARSANRAFEGAPPTIPHAVDQRGYPACLSCHGEGAAFDGRNAPKISHEPFANCTQCHAPEVGLSPSDHPPLSAGNTFAGLIPAELGGRAWEGAPPVIPHTLHMREQCGSCHGPHGRPGMRSTHLDRFSCTQCHATQAELNQRPSPPFAPGPP